MSVFSVSVTPHVESEFNFTRKLETMNVIPGYIRGAGWQNETSLYEQSVPEDAIFQSFNKSNSAYRKSMSAPVGSPSSEDSDTSSPLPDVTPVTEHDTAGDEVSTEDTNGSSSSDSVGVESPEQETADESQPSTPSESADAPVSLKSESSGIFGFFRTVTERLLFAQESVIEDVSGVTVPQSSLNSSETDTLSPEEFTSDTTVNDGSEAEQEDIPQSVSSDERETVSPSLPETPAQTAGTPYILMRDFGIPELASGQFITNVQLRMSLGAQIYSALERMPELRVEYSFTGNEWDEAGSVILESETSNALNGGYFLFALPTITDRSMLEQLQVRVSVVGTLAPEDELLIDAAWLEVNTEVFDKELLRERLLPAALSELALPTMHEVLSDTLDFTREDAPVFVLRYESQRNAAVRMIRNLFGRNLAEIQSVTVVRKDVGEVNVTPTIDMTSDGLWTIQIPKDEQDDLEPGTYELKIVVDEGGKLFTDTLEFQWGLLAQNPDKTEYEVGETAVISLAALSPSGNTLCDANLALYIINPEGFIYRTPVTPSGLCNGNNVVDVPDYTASFTPTLPGTYEVYLEHIGENGELLAHTDDTFKVTETQSLSLSREGMTRIYPRAPYSMVLTVESQDGYEGTLIEQVPEDFTIVDTDGLIASGVNGKEIRWDVNVPPGGSVSVSYAYDAPDISPYLYTLGPARLTGTPDSATLPDMPASTPLTEPTTQSEPEPPVETTENVPQEIDSAPNTDTSASEVILEQSVTTEEDDANVSAPEAPVSPESVPDTGESQTDTFETITDTAPTVQASITEPTPNSTSAFIEHRPWQIASDATGSMIVFWTDGATIPSGWTCISCSSTSTFYQRFPLGGATYGTQGGVSTTTHTADGTVNQATGANTEDNSTNAVNIETHTHTITPVVAATTTLPAYRQLRVIQNNSAGTPATIPAGAILIFDGTLPSGWGRYTALDDRYPYGQNTITSGGSNTHWHSVTGTTSAPGGTTYLARTNGTTVTAALSTHTHTLSASTTPVNLEPPYIQVVFATSSSATATPLTAIAMWSDTPPAGWLDRSSNDTRPFYNKYIKGGATYGTTGGSETHTHANFSASSSAPIGTATRRSGALGANATHQHLIDVSNFSTASNTPPYVTVIYGKYYGLVPIYDQSAFKWFTNVNSTTVTDPWPTSTLDVGENEAIDSSFTALKNGDVLRLRLQLSVENSTTTGEDFKLQYGTTSSVCTAVTSWTDVGSATSSAPWIGYTANTPTDGVTLSSSTLTGTDVLESYEEQNPTVALPNQIGIGKRGEWDFVLKQNNATAATNYCFRMVKSDGTELFSYTQYPMLVTDQAPNVPTLESPFGNEKVATTTPRFEFSGTDPEADDLTYQIQIDDDYTFASVNVDRNTVTNASQFANVTTPSDKDPYNQGELVRFTLPAASALTNGTTYYWRVRATDPTGSNAYGSWSTIYSFTVDTSVTVSTWFETMEEQFDSGTLIGTDALVTDRVQLIAGSTTGTTTSTALDFLDGSTGNAWGTLSWSDDETVGDIKYRIEYFNETTQSWTFIPDAVLSGNSTGFDTSGVSLLGLDTDTYRLLRLNAVFTNSGGTPILYDWTVSWGYRIETVTEEALFPSEKAGTTTPSFIFYTSDPQNDDLVYEVQWSTSYDFAASTTRTSDVHAGFVNLTNGGDTSPFTSGNSIQFTIQAADALTNGTTYWWRARARDPLGANQYSLYTDPRSFTIDTTVTVSTWFQTTQSQFTTDILSGTLAQSSGSVTVATTSDETLVVYAEGNVSTPRYREWDGSVWSAESNALDVGGTINWVIVKSSPIDNEYVMGTLDTNADVNVQVYRNGTWANLTEITTSVPNAAMRAFDIAYEQTSGDAIVVSCDGNADPVYYVWNGTTWTNGGSLNRVNGNTCGWVKLVSDPTSDEIIAVIRDTSGVRYEARVWNGSSWGNSTTLGSMNQPTHEGMAAEYEESGNQAVVVVSNGTASSFSWKAWNGTVWSATTTQTLGDDFEAGSIATDDGSDNMVLCYVDEDGDIGTVRWDGSAWQTVPAAFTELDTAWTTASGVYNDRPIECAYEVGGARDGYIMAAYATTTGMAYRAWNGAAWSAALTVSSIQDAPRVQMRRTGANLLQVLAFDNTNDRYDYSGWNGTSWSTFQTLETDGSVGASPYKEPFMMAERKPGITGSAVVSPAIDFYDGSGPYWQQMSWTDSEPGGSTILYQMEYYDGDSWELVPDSLIPGNSVGTSTSPMNLSNVLPVSTYSLLRPVANLTCNLGTCPSLSDWTVTWAAGITVSGTAYGYNQTSSTTAGTVNIALNGVLQSGKTGTISNGSWSIPNVNVAPGDVVTVFINGVSDASEAVAVARYDGVGDISGMTLYDRHLTLGSNDATSTPFTNAELGLYDATNDEDLFFDVLGTSLTICGDVGCGDAELIIKSGSIYRPGGTVNTHDIEINGTFRPEGNTIYVSGSWDNNATSTSATSTVIFTATSSSETLDETGALSPSFYNLTFGTTTGNATWTLVTSVDVNNALTITRGTLTRGGIALTIGGSATIAANGFISGVGTTTFDGTGTSIYTDSNVTAQNIGHVVVDGTSKTLQLGSALRAQSVRIGSDDILDVSTGNYALTVLGDFVNTNTFVPRSGTVNFVSTTTNRTITVGGSSFYDLAFNGVGGTWSFTDATLSVGNDFTIATGTVTLPSGTTTITGSFTNATGTFAHNNGTVVFNSSSAETLSLAGTTFTNAFYNVRFAGSGTFTFIGQNATTSNDFRIAQGTVVMPSGTLTVVGNFMNTAGSFTANNGTIKFSGAGTHAIDTNASFYNLLFSGAGSSSFVDTSITTLEDFTVLGGTVTMPSGTFTIGGSIANSGTLTSNGGTVLLNSADTGETIDLGTSSLNVLTVNSATGGWTFTTSATTTGAFTLTNAASFTLSSGRTLSVGGTFTNSVGGASTTWTGSTLSLEAGAYTINTKTVSGDAYETLRVKANTDIAMWNSSATTYSVDATGSLYSQDHGGADGNLYIYGSYERTAGTEYWSYGTDFDGSTLSSTSSRQVDVRFASGASASFSTSTLNITGSSTASTTIANQGSGTYTVSVTGGTTTALYYGFTDLGTQGLSLLGGTKVTSLTNGKFVPSIGGGTGITVSAQTVDANPGLQIYRVEFSTTTVISAANVTQNGGSPTSYWWFRESVGNIDGEQFDSDTGNPGSIRWDDSSLIITLSGTVYAADGVTPLGAPTCGAGTPIRAVVHGGATYVGSCAGDGTFTLPNVVIVGDTTITVYLDGASGGERAVTVTKTPTTNITNLNLIVNRTIVRHEDVSAMTIADLALYDSSDDSDILFTAATGTVNTLVTQANTGLIVWATTTFTPGGSVTLVSGGSGASYDGSLTLQASSTYTGAGTSTYSIGGTFTQGTGARFVPASTSVLMTATTSGKGIVSATGETINFNDLSFTGVGGGWNLTGNLSLTGALNLATGTFTGTGDITLQNGSFYGNGLLSLGSGTTTLAVTNTLGGSQAWTFANLVLGNGSVTGTTSKASVATTTILGKLTIATGHYFEVFGSTLELRGSGTVFVENGSLIEATSTVRYSGTAGSNVISTNYYNLAINALGGSPSYTGTGLGIVVLGNLFVGGTATTTFTLDTNDPALDVDGSVTIETNGAFIGSNSAAFTVGGSWDNNGSFTGSGGTVIFDTTGAATVASGASSWSSLTASSTGSLTFTESATSTGTFTIRAANDFILASGQSLAVGGTFQNLLGGADTVWTGSTLYLYGGGNYTINASTTQDAYERLLVGANTQIRMWNSSAATTETGGSASLYSQDHAGSDGSLYIFGAYVKTSGTDYMSYTTDFDGTNISASPRQVSVRIASGGSVLYQGGGLAVVGTSSLPTTFANQGSGTYSFRVGGTASTTMSQYSFASMDQNGLTFSGTPNVVGISNGTFTVGVASGTAITVGGTVIEQNPARTFTNNTFGTSTSGLAFNVTATGTTASSWRFTNHAGSIDGEFYDVDPAGDPGYIVWDDSAAQLTISGKVYLDEGTTTSSACDGVTQNIVLRVAGLTTYQTSCNAATGQYSIPNVSYSPGDSFVVYIDGEVEKAATISEDPVTSISNLDLYENRVIVRHEGADPLSIDDMALWDASDDADIPFTAVNGTPDTLTLPADRKLIVWAGKTFVPGGNVTVSGGGGGAAYDGTLELFTNATFDATGAELHSVGGSLIMGTGAILDDDTSTFTFTTTGAARTIDTNDQSFYNLTLNGGGSWTITNTSLDIGNDMTITQGSVTLPTGTTTIAGSFVNTGGSFAQNGGSMYFTSSGAETVRPGSSSFGTTTFAGSGTWTYLGGNATTTGNFTITSGTVSAPTSTLTVSGSFINRSVFTHNSGTVRMTSNRASTTIFAGSSDLYAVTIAGTGTFVFTDPTEALLGSLTLVSGTTTLPTSTISIGGSLVSQGGAFTHATGTVLFNSSDGGEFITPGSSTFTNLTIAAPTGGYTVTASATTTGNFTLSSANSFILQSGSTLAIGGVFTNLVGGASTTWTGTTLVIKSGSNYTVNSKTQGGDVYNIVTLGNNTDLRLWNSSATTTLLDTLSSLYSQDNAGVDGELYIYGNYTRSTGADYWSAATDFDGTATAARAVTVRHAAGATSTFSGGTLAIVGTASATTTVTNQGSGTYSLQITGGTLNAQYYALRNMNVYGLVLDGNTTVTSIAQGDLELAVNGGALITLSSTTLTYNAASVISGMRFATTTAITGVNVALVGTTSAAWTFTSHRGNLDGEAFDDDGLTDCGSVRWDDSTCLLTEQVGYRWRNDNGGEGVPNSEWYSQSWTKRKRVTVSNTDATTYTNAVVEVTVPYDSDMQSDFDDLVFTDSAGVTLLKHFKETYTASTEATVWVKIPSLAASSDTTIYMYYGNGGASDTSTSTTFITLDTFEDGSISEYSGDGTGQFTVNTSAPVRERSYSLKASDPNNGQTLNGGMYNNSAAVAQGQKIRWFQYIDTSTGSGDEVCTTFGTQTDSTNYAVCLELFGTDRMVIASDVDYNDTSGNVLSSTAVSYQTGWYEVEVAWMTGGTIQATLLKDNVVVATTSATDSTYTSGGIGYALWFYHGAWDMYSARTLLTTEPTVSLGYEQVSGGASWAAALNTAIAGVDAGTIVRPRFIIENTGLTVSDQYRLMYSAKGAAPSCEAISAGSYTAVPPQSSCGTAALCMQSSSQFSDGAGTTDVLGGTGTFVPGRIVEDPSNTASAVSLNSNEYTEVEYAIAVTVNAIDPAYCLRVTDAGTTIDSYTKVAELQLVFEPSISSITFNDGNDIVLAPGATTTIYATGTVSDQNGYADIAYATTTMFRSGVGAQCTADTNNCYIAGPSSCSYVNCSGASCDVVCRADFYYFADPTDTGSTFDSESWGAELSVRDQSGLMATQTAPYVDLLTLRALTANNSIDYGALEVNSNTGSYNASTTFYNIGNDAIDVLVEGTNLTDGLASTIPVTEQIFATTTFTYSACTYCTQLSASSTTYELDLSKPTTTTPGVSDVIYWGIEIPYGVSASPHVGTNIFYATGDN